jgi:hypothetical protein
MIVEKILKKLTPQRIKKEIEAIQNIKLPKELQGWVDEYQRVGERDIFFWKWIYKGIQETTLPMVTKKYQKSIWKSEFLLIMFIILLDDTADRTRNTKLLDELLKIPFEKKCLTFKKLTQKDKIHLKFTIKIWCQIEKIIKRYPKYKEFKKIFYYDIRQIINALRYNYLINTNHCLINETEYWLYSPHTMQIITLATIDLMCIPEFDISELGIMREIMFQAQKMGRIGNCISTWEREIKDNDFTSAIIANALENNTIMLYELKKENYRKLIKKIKNGKTEEKILKNWEECYLQISKLSKKIKSIKINEVSLGVKKLFTMYLAIRKKKYSS